MLIGKLKRSNLVVKHSNVLVDFVLVLGQVLEDVDLMAKSDTPKELDQVSLALALRPNKDIISLSIPELLLVLNLIRQIFQRYFVLAVVK